MIRPWYRSLMLWLGLPGVLFLIWAWWDSDHCYSWVWRVEQSCDLALMNWRSGVAVSGTDVRSKNEFSTMSLRGGGFSLFDMKTTSRLPASRWDFARHPIPAAIFQTDSPRYLPFRESRSYPTGSTAWVVFVPHWILIGCYLVAWLVALFMWQLRKARLLRATLPETS